MATTSTCNYQVDYSTITGERILPFVFSLNMDDSILYPSEGEYQKFCYDITAVGQDTSQYADLSHFLFGICNTITQDDMEPSVPAARLIAHLPSHKAYVLKFRSHSAPLSKPVRRSFNAVPFQRQNVIAPMPQRKCPLPLKELRK